MDVVLKIPNEMARALREIAQAEDVSLGQVVRHALVRDLRRRRRPKRDVRTDEALVAPLRSLLADDLAFSPTWEELQIGLGRKGYILRPAGGGLVLCAVQTGARLCKASELGYSHLALARRFGCPFPDHSNGFQIQQQLREHGHRE